MSHNRKDPYRDPKSPLYEPHRDPKSEFFIPNDPDNRKGVEPAGARIEGPGYVIDAESLCMPDSLGGRPYLDPIEGVERLVDHVSKENFHLEPICRACETWHPSRVLKPNRKGVLDSTNSCFGCLFSHLNGTAAEFADNNRDAAFTSWASARRDVAALEKQRADATGRQKDTLTSRLDKAYKRLTHASRRCKRLGFSPSMPQQGQESWSRPLMAQTRDQRRKALFKGRPSSLPSPNCRNCKAWQEDLDLSSDAGTFGMCWVRDEVTKATYWCSQHAYIDSLTKR